MLEIIHRWEKDSNDTLLAARADDMLRKPFGAGRNDSTLLLPNQIRLIGRSIRRCHSYTPPKNQIKLHPQPRPKRPAYHFPKMTTMTKLTGEANIAGEEIGLCCGCIMLGIGRIETRSRVTW